MEITERPESFSGLLLRHRHRVGITQRDLAARAGASQRSVQDWEAGVTLPSAERLQALIRALLEANCLIAGHETSEARALWAAVEHEAPRMHTAFDSAWFARLLATHAPLTSVPTSGPRLVAEPPAGAAEPTFSFVPRGARAQDWGEAPDTAAFIGRAEELALLQASVLEDQCRVIAVLGMGGIGKTTLTARLAQSVAPGFERVYWRSLRNAPPATEWLAGAIGFLSDQQLVPPESQADRITALVRLLRNRRCLLVLDNSETLLEPRQSEGRYRAGLEGFGQILQSVGDTTHQSCLLLNGREAPPELALLGRAVRILELHGLGIAEARALLVDRQLHGDSQAWTTLVDLYDGNGLALKIVGETIRQVYDGDIAAFLADTLAMSSTVFGGIRRLLDTQVERLSSIEHAVLTRLAVAREPVNLTELSKMAPGAARSAVVEAIENLRRRSLVERDARVETQGQLAAQGGGFTLHSMVLEYVTDRLVETVAEEIRQGAPVMLVEQPLVDALAKDYVRQTQERLIGTPVLQRLQAEANAISAESQLRVLLDRWRGRPVAEQGYGPGNVVNLLRVLRGDLRAMDLSRLSLRQAYLAEVNAQDASLAGAQLADSVLAEGFDLPGSTALNAGGTVLAVGTPTGRIWVWRVGDRKPLLTVRGHTGMVRGVAISSDARLMVSAGVDATACVWDLATGQPGARLQGHTRGIRSIALSSGGELAASTSDDETVRLWDTRRGVLRATLRGHTGVVWCVALSANGRLVASGGVDRTVRLWDADSGQLLTILRGHQSVVRGVAVSDDGGIVVSCGDDATIRTWNARTGQEIGTLRSHAGFVPSLALSGDGRLAVSGSFDGTLQVWDVERQVLVAIMHGHTGEFVRVALSVDGRLAASSSTDGTLRLWDVYGKRLVTTLQGHPGVIWRIALSDDGSLVASGGADGRVRVWSASTGQLVATLAPQSGVVRGVALNGDGMLVAGGSMDGNIRLWEVGTGRLLATLQAHTGGARCQALSLDGRLMASGGVDETVKLWDLPGRQVLATLHGHAGWVRGVALSRSGAVVASCGDDAIVRLWDVARAQPLFALRGHSGIVWAVALSDDGRLVASASEDGTVIVWDAESGQRKSTLHGHLHSVHGVALSGNGAIAVTGGVDTTVRVWDTRNGTLKSTLRGHSGDVWDVAISKDGRLIASGSDDGSVKIWDVQSGACLRTLRSDGLYQRLDITGLTGVTDAQRAALLALGAFETPT